MSRAAPVPDHRPLANVPSGTGSYLSPSELTYGPTTVDTRDSAAQVRSKKPFKSQKSNYFIGVFYFV